MKRLNHRLTRVNYPECPNCGTRLSSLFGENQCPGCKDQVDYEWWSTKSQDAARKAIEKSEIIRCNKCENDVLLIPDNMSWKIPQFICPDCENIVLDVTCKSCWDYHHDDVSFYDCDGYNPEKQRFRLFSRDDVKSSNDLSKFIRNLGSKCKRETRWDFSQTTPELFQGSQIGVLVCFNANILNEPIGFVTISYTPERNEASERFGCDSQFMIADLFVIPEERRKGNSKLLLLELKKMFPELICGGEYNYSNPATEGGMAAMRSAFAGLKPNPI